MTILLGKFLDYKKGISIIEELLTTFNLDACHLISLGGFFLLHDTSDELNYDRDITYLQDILSANNCTLICIEEMGSDPSVFKDNNYRNPKDNIRVESSKYYHKESRTAFITVDEGSSLIMDMTSDEHDNFINGYYMYLDHLLDYKDKCPIDNLVTNTVDNRLLETVHVDMDRHSFINYTLDPLKHAYDEFFKHSDIKQVFLPSSRDHLRISFDDRFYRTIMNYQSNILCLN